MFGAKSRTDAALDLVTSENLTQDLLQEIFDTALLETRLDGDGDIVVKEGGVSCFVFAQAKKDVITFMVQFGFKPGTARLAQLELANRINAKMHVVKAECVGDSLRFEYDLVVTGGVSRRNVVQALKRFASIPRSALRQYEEGDVIE